MPAPDIISIPSSSQEEAQVGSDDHPAEENAEGENGSQSDNDQEVSTHSFRMMDLVWPLADSDLPRSDQIVTPAMREKSKSL